MYLCVSPGACTILMPPRRQASEPAQVTKLPPADQVDHERRETETPSLSFYILSTWVNTYTRKIITAPDYICVDATFSFAIRYATSLSDADTSPATWTGGGRDAMWECVCVCVYIGIPGGAVHAKTRPSVGMRRRRRNPHLAVARSRAKWKKSTDDAFTPYL